MRIGKGSWDFNLSELNREGRGQQELGILNEEILGEDKIVNMKTGELKINILKLFYL